MCSECERLSQMMRAAGAAAAHLHTKMKTRTVNEFEIMLVLEDIATKMSKEARRHSSMPPRNRKRVSYPPKR